MDPFYYFGVSIIAIRYLASQTPVCSKQDDPFDIAVKDAFVAQQCEKCIPQGNGCVEVG